MKLIDTKHSRMLANAMDSFALRQKAIAANIANADTPGYKRLEVRFEEALGKAQRGVSGQNIDQVKGDMHQTQEEVVLENEMMNLADNQIRTQLVTKELRHHFSMLRTAITSRPQG